MATESFNKPPSYPEMICEAIEALNQEGGSNKSSISTYIESKYGDLGKDHSEFLTLHLDNMKQTGELIFLKNNYIKPGTDVPQKRGRGRPPKPKVPLPPGAESAEIAPPRPRGRPRKDPNAPPTSKKPKPTPATPNSTGRPRGRPRKVRPQSAQYGDDVEES
ncbi:HMG-Y-related protein A-like [Nicotiana tabacum]|uniref:HMG-Y-related protein A-like n=1 Tax=Nicotiana tabacum TaxID=4097 RepID=A0A1S4BP93_TOBAC|nr:PREDICTED: HMG-Y-related protein A-like [Nicotiana tabacum]XP_016490699.1 PREDICTED: HMG-Y-related protein A-like [Nicotiana tabacum]